MSDYYSQRDRHMRTTPDYYDNVGTGGAAWLWAGILLFAIVALVAAMFTGGEGGEATAPAPGAETAVPAPADATPTIIE